MNRRFVSVLLFSLVVSGVASFVVYRFILLNVVAAASRPVRKQRLLVAAHTLQMGTLIREADLRWADSADAVPARVVNDMSQAIGRGVITTIYEGEPLAPERLAPKGAGAGLAAMIPVGKRAVALKVDQVVGLAGFVLPGMRVDVIVAGNGNNGNAGGIVSRTALQNIEVLSAGQKIEKSTDGKPENAQVVNLLVTPDQAETLSLASSETKVQLVLRNPLDTKEEVTHGTSVAALLGISLSPPPPTVITQTIRTVQPPPVTPPPASDTIEVFSGTKRSEQRLDR